MTDTNEPIDAVDHLDPDFRPSTYFRPHTLDQYLLSQVKGAVARERLQALFDEGREAEARQFLTATGLTPDHRKSLESFHPMFMGGNYLPDIGEGEVEIARINLRSVTSDVTSVYARTVNGVIHYRVVDEYEGETLKGPARKRTRTPMTLGKLTDFFLRAWPLVAVLERNYAGDLERALGFFTAESAFYPQLDRLCRERVTAAYRETYGEAVSEEDDPGDWDEPQADSP